MLSRGQLQQAAADSGFQIESYEKVHVLVRLLEAVRMHPLLGPRVALKGGTALNLLVFRLPRLSVDIDLNYVGTSDRKTMLAERPRVEQALQQVAGRIGLTVKRVPTAHAGGKWRLTYVTALGRPGSIEVDVNFMLRTPYGQRYRETPIRLAAKKPLRFSSSKIMSWSDRNETYSQKGTAAVSPPQVSSTGSRVRV
jgi:predicted nucleotidyltransferase component of viral defense system